MADDFSYRISTTRFDEHYTPAEKLPSHDQLRQPRPG